jgi:beta-glucanase (GH16 family)
MSHTEAQSTSIQLSRRDPRRPRWITVAPALLLLVAAGLLCGCASDIGNTASADKAQVTVIATATTAPSQTPAPATSPLIKPGYQLVFDEDFSGDRLDPKRWVLGLPWGKVNRNEQQFYTPDSVRLANGTLAITARKAAQGGRPYTSGAICTDDRFDFKYGYVEMRAKVPRGAGLWSAFWLLRRHTGSADEADVAEVLGSDPTQVFSVLHYGTMANKQIEINATRGADLSAGFHTYALKWEPGLMVWYVDGAEVFRTTKGVPSEPLIIIANLAVGAPGSWAGAPDATTAFPATYAIDYIRVWQAK